MNNRTIKNKDKNKEVSHWTIKNKLLAKSGNGFVCLNCNNFVGQDQSNASRHIIACENFRISFEELQRFYYENHQQPSQEAPPTIPHGNDGTERSSESSSNGASPTSPPTLAVGSDTILNSGPSDSEHTTESASNPFGFEVWNWSPPREEFSQLRATVQDLQRLVNVQGAQVNLIQRSIGTIANELIRLSSSLNNQPTINYVHVDSNFGTATNAIINQKQQNKEISELGTLFGLSSSEKQKVGKEDALDGESSQLPVSTPQSSESSKAQKLDEDEELVDGDEMDELTSQFSVSTELYDNRGSVSEHQLISQSIDNLLSPMEGVAYFEATDQLRSIASESYIDSGNDISIQIIPENDLDIAVAFANAMFMNLGFWIETPQTMMDGLVSMPWPSRIEYIHNNYSTREIVAYMMGLTVSLFNSHITNLVEAKSKNLNVYVVLRHDPDVVSFLKEFSLPRLNKITNAAKFPLYLANYIRAFMANVYFYLCSLDSTLATEIREMRTHLGLLCYNVARSKHTVVRTEFTDEVPQVVQKMIDLLKELEKIECPDETVNRGTLRYRADRSECSSFTGEKIPSKMLKTE